MTRSIYLCLETEAVQPGVHRFWVPVRRAGVRAVLALPSSGLLLAAFLLVASSASAQNESPETTADSPNFTLNTTGSTESGGYVQSDSVNFTLNTTGFSGVQSDSADFTLNTLLSGGPFTLMHPVILAGGGFQFSFTNGPGTTFRVFGTTNLSIAFNNWIFLGSITDQPPGFYQFSDSQTTNYPRRFYRVVTP